LELGLFVRNQDSKFDKSFNTERYVIAHFSSSLCTEKSHFVGTTLTRQQLLKVA